MMYLKLTVTNEWLALDTAWEQKERAYMLDPFKFGRKKITWRESCIRPTAEEEVVLFVHHRHGFLVRLLTCLKDGWIKAAG